MPDQYVIAGVIELAGNPNRKNLKVQAFDRDLPSLERLAGYAPSLVGEALTDGEGRFQITYASAQFARADGTTNADVSFRVFDPSGGELAVRIVRALERGYRGDQVIFNIPDAFNVALSVEGERQGGQSEYELLASAVSPLIEPLPLTAITNEDVAFLAGELGYAEQDESRQHLEWFRRSALLAALCDAPAEAFYGWGRQGLPAALAELVRAPLSEVPTILAKVSASASDRLRDALLAAIAQNIISASLRDRASAIAAGLHRRTQQSFTLRMRLEEASAAGRLIGYAVTTRDVDHGNADLGTEVTGSQGEFAVSYFDDAEAGRTPRNLHFRVHAPNADDVIEVDQRVQPGEDVITVLVPIASADRSLGTIQQTAHLELPGDLVQTLQNTWGIRSLADIRRRGGLHRIASMRQLDSPMVRRLDALADLDRLCTDIAEAGALINRQYNSVLAIAAVTRATFVAAISGEGSPIGPERAAELHIAAKAQTDLLDQIFAGIAQDIAAGLRPLSGVAPDESSPLPEEQNHG